jgi:hypothetical protein
VGSIPPPAPSNSGVADLIAHPERAADIPLDRIPGCSRRLRPNKPLWPRSRLRSPPRLVSPPDPSTPRESEDRLLTAVDLRICQIYIPKDGF